MRTTLQSIFAGRRVEPTPLLRLVLPNGLAVTGTQAELGALAGTIREEVRAQVLPARPVTPITYALPGHRPLQGPPQAWLRLAAWIEGTLQPPGDSRPNMRARFPGTQCPPVAWTAPSRPTGQTTRLVTAGAGIGDSQPLPPAVRGAAGDPADPRAPLTSAPQQYLVRVLIPDMRAADGWGPHPTYPEEIEVWASSLTTASLFVILDPQRGIHVVPGQIVAARWAWHTFATPDAARPWTHAYTCFLDAAQIAMIQAELDHQTELLI